MYKFRRSVFPSCICAAVMVVCLVFLSGLTPAQLPVQEVYAQTEKHGEARETFNRGIEAFKNGQYDEAVTEFERAKQLDPKWINARFYLATTYASQYIPGAPSETNLELGRKAVEEYREALSLDGQDLNVIDGIASILFQMAGQPFDSAKFEESKSFDQKHIQIKPHDPEPYYFVGVIDWTLSFRANNELRERYNRAHLAHQIEVTDPLPPEVRAEYVREYGSIIDEGVESLKHAIELRPDYDDAMAYLNLLYRRKADTVTYQDERDGLIKMADDLIDKVMEIKQKRAQLPSQP